MTPLRTVPLAPTPRAPSAPAPASGPAEITVHIERLVLHGLDVRDGDAFRGAVEAELHRLFAEKGWPSAPGVSTEQARLQTAPVSLPPARGPAAAAAAAAGTSVGGALYGGLVA